MKNIVTLLYFFFNRHNRILETIPHQNDSPKSDYVKKCEKIYSKWKPNTTSEIDNSHAVQTPAWRVYKATRMASY